MASFALRYARTAPTRQVIEADQLPALLQDDQNVQIWFNDTRAHVLDARPTDLPDYIKLRLKMPSDRIHNVDVRAKRRITRLLATT